MRGGLEIAGLCDLRICGESSRFGVPINRLGLVMAYAEIGSLIALAGEAVALEILLEGRVFDAREAKEKGLVTRVVPDDQVEKEARESAGRIADGAPLVARWHKKFARRLRDAKPLTSGIRDVVRGLRYRGFRIGYQTFLAKQKPNSGQVLHLGHGDPRGTRRYTRTRLHKEGSTDEARIPDAGWPIELAEGRARSHSRS